MKDLFKNFHLLAGLLGSIGSIAALLIIYRSKFEIDIIKLEPFIIFFAAFAGLLTFFLSRKLKERERTVFIIYAHKDKDKAHQIRTELNKFGVNALMDEQVIKIGDNIKEGIEKNITSANKILILLSEATMNSDWIVSEIQLAKKANKQIFPAMISKSVVPPSLEGIKYAELFEINKDTIYPLIKALRG